MKNATARRLKHEQVAAALSIYPFGDDFGDSNDRIVEDRVVPATGRAKLSCHICGAPSKRGEHERTLTAIWVAGGPMRYRWCFDCCAAYASSNQDFGAALTARYLLRWEGVA